MQQYKRLIGICEQTPTSLIEPSIHKNDYYAHYIEIQKHKVIFRVAKTTPTKPGLFVAIWKKNEQGKNEPYDHLDSFDNMVIYAEQNQQKGVFVFPKKDLIELSIISSDTKNGKMGIRLYPSWSKDLNPQAKKTQEKQAPFFFTILK